MGFGPIKPLQEQITLMNVNERIEYKIIKITQTSFGYY
jgi:hypothetical protein